MCQLLALTGLKFHIIGKVNHSWPVLNSGCTQYLQVMAISFQHATASPVHRSLISLQHDLADYNAQSRLKHKTAVCDISSLSACSPVVCCKLELKQMTHRPT